MLKKICKFSAIGALSAVLLCGNASAAHTDASTPKADTDTITATSTDASNSVAAMQASSVSVYVDGKALCFDTSPRLLNGRTMVPMRGIFEALGATVEWSGETRTVTAQKDDRTVVLTVDDPHITVNGVAAELDCAPTIRQNRTLVPVRAVAEAFGVSVDWLSDIKTVVIDSSDIPTSDTELYDFNHVLRTVDTRFAEQYRAIGWLDSIDELYTTLYSSTGKQAVPVDTRTQNIENGWSESAPLLELTDKSYFEQNGDYVKVFWHPINHADQTVRRYTLDLHYVVSGGKGGYSTVTKNVSGSFADGDELGHTTTMAENSYIDFYCDGKCKTLLVGKVTLYFAKGDPVTFWCGQGITKGAKWDGTLYGDDLIALSESGNDTVLYPIYSLKTQENAVVSGAELSQKLSDGWYLTPVTTMYYPDGLSIVTAKAKVEALKAAGLTDDPKEISVHVYSTLDGTEQYILPYLLDEYEKQGWKLYTEPITVLYHYATGTQRAFESSLVDQQLANGWARTRDEVYATVYTLSGESREILRVDLDGYLATDWYETPVVRVYDPNGLDKIIAKEELASYQADGWVTDPEAIKATLYRPDKSTLRVMPYEIEAKLADGWYTEPVTEIFASNGDSAVVLTATLASYIADGWSENEADFYTDYYTLSSVVRGLISDKEQYLAAGFRTVPYPIRLSTDSVLERASVWSKYTYSFRWQPQNTSGQAIDSYRIEYHVLTDDEPYDYNETFYKTVAPNETLCNEGYDGSFLVTLPEGSDRFVIGNITLRYADGTVETFWCGQRICLGQESWNGVLCDSNFTQSENDLERLNTVSHLKQLP